MSDPRPLAIIRSAIEDARPRLAPLVPSGVSVDRISRVALAAIGRSSDLLACSVPSLLQALAQAAQLGLEIGGALGEAYLVPYKGAATLIVGYRGLLSLARRSGQIASIEARVVRDGDRFAVRYGTTPEIAHEPAIGSGGSLVAVYAVARLTDGMVQSEVMSRAEIDAIRARSKTSGSGPWVTDYDEMARKTVVRRLAKYLPMSADLADALTVEEVDAEPGPMAPAAPKPALAARVAAARLAEQAQSPAEVRSEPGRDVEQEYGEERSR